MIARCKYPGACSLGPAGAVVSRKICSSGHPIFAPDVVFEDAAKYLPSILAKRGKSIADLASALRYLRQIIELVELDFYTLFEKEARSRLRGRDEEDWPILATALGLGCPIWTEDADFFGTGVAAWTTSRIEIFLNAQVASSQPGDED